VDGDAAWRAARAQPIADLDAHFIATNIPGASAISQVGTFLSGSPTPFGQCTLPHPIPTLFAPFILPGAVLDPNRILVGSRSNFGAELADGVGEVGSFLSIDPSGRDLSVPPDFAQSDGQASAPPPVGGEVQMFSANSPGFLNSVNNKTANTANYTGVSNPLGLSNNNAFGRLWPANAPFFDTGVGSSSILDPTGLPLKGAPNPKIGGVYVGNLTNRDAVAFTPPPQPGFQQEPQVIPGALNTGAVGTALLGPSPDGTCKAVFAVVTADGAIVQEHTLKGLDGLAPAGTVQSIVGLSWEDSPGVEPRFGVIMNPYIPRPLAVKGVVRQLFVSEPFSNTIAVINLVISGTAPDQVFGLGSVSRISSRSLNVPVDLAPVTRDADNVNWASNTALDQGSDFYVANRGDNTIVRMTQKGGVVAVRSVDVDNSPLDDASLNGIATSPDGTTIYVTFTGQPSQRVGGVFALPAF